MRIQTFSILTGSEACNARCPFCVSKMTPLLGMTPKAPEVNWRNFGIAWRLAKQGGATTAMLTGKGEPTLFPGMITEYLERLFVDRPFPLVELQTNGIQIMERPELFQNYSGEINKLTGTRLDSDPYLERWYNLGLTTIAISIVHWDPEKNRQIYLPYRDRYIDLPGLIKVLHDRKFSVRLTNVLVAGCIDSPEMVEQMVGFAREHKVEQLTLTPVNYPDTEVKQHPEVYDWTVKHHLPKETLQDIKGFLDGVAEPLLQLAHGAMVYDFDGQNVCLNNCLNVDPHAEEMRNLIFHPDGHLRYYWQYPGAIIL